MRRNIFGGGITEVYDPKAIRKHIHLQISFSCFAYQEPLNKIEEYFYEKAENSARYTVSPLSLRPLGTGVQTPAFITTIAIVNSLKSE